MCPSGSSKHTANEQAIIKPGPVFNLITSRRVRHEFCYWNQVFAVFSLDGDHDFPGNLKGSKSFLSQHFPWPWSPTRLQRSAMVVGEGLGVHGGKWGPAPYWKNPKLPMAQVRPAGMRQPETWNLLVGCTDNLVHKYMCTYLQSLRSSHHNDKWIQKHVSGFWMKYNDLTLTSLEWYCNNLNHPQVALLQLLTAWWIINIQPDFVFQCYSLIPTWLRRW